MIKENLYARNHHAMLKTAIEFHLYNYFVAVNQQSSASLHFQLEPACKTLRTTYKRQNNFILSIQPTWLSLIRDNYSNYIPHNFSYEKSYTNQQNFSLSKYSNNNDPGFDSWLWPRNRWISSIHRLVPMYDRLVLR